MFFTPIGKSKYCEQYDVVFELSEVIQVGSKVILVNYKHKLILLSITSSIPIMDSDIVDHILSLPGCSQIKDSIIGELSIQPPCSTEPYQIYVGTTLLISVYKPQIGLQPLCDNWIIKPSVQTIDSDGTIYSFQDTLFEYNLRDIVTIAPFIKQVNHLLPID